MSLQGILAISTIFLILFLGRKDSLQDRFGNPTVRPGGWTFVCLVVAGFFLLEAIRLYDDPFYQRHPENTYILLGFVVFGFASALFMHYSHVTLLHDRVVEHMPPFWNKEILISQLCSIRNEGKVTVLRSTNRKTIGVPHMFSGVPGFITAVQIKAPSAVDRGEA